MNDEPIVNKEREYLLSRNMVKAICFNARCSDCQSAFDLAKLRDHMQLAGVCPMDALLGRIIQYLEDYIR